MVFPEEYEGFEKTEENRKIKEARLLLVTRYELNRYYIDLIQNSETREEKYYLLGKKGKKTVLNREPQSREEAWEIMQDWISENKIKASIS